MGGIDPGPLPFAFAIAGLALGAVAGLLLAIVLGISEGLLMAGGVAGRALERARRRPPA